MKKVLRAMSSILLTSILAFSACQSTTTTPTDTLFVGLENAKIERFDSVELKLEQGVKDVTWKSSNESVAVIEGNTLIGLKAGTVVISAIKDNKQQDQTITVYDEGRTPSLV